MALEHDGEAGRVVLDLAQVGLRAVNGRLQGAPVGSNWVVHNPAGAHALACGLGAAIDTRVDGHVGYYCAGMNQLAHVTVDGNCGPGVAENMMSGRVDVLGNASQAAGASGCGGLLVVHGDATARCGISMKGIDIVVFGSVGHAAAFMGQAGHLVICGDAGDGLGDSLYEAVIYVCGSAEGLGADCIEKPMTDSHRVRLAELLDQAGSTADPASFKRYGSARKLYNFDVDNADAY